MKIYKCAKNGKSNLAGYAIRYMREKNGLSQEQLAAQLQLKGLDINQKAVSRIETGERVVPDYELCYFSDVLNAPICFFLNREECK